MRPKTPKHRAGKSISRKKNPAKGIRRAVGTAENGFSSWSSIADDNSCAFFAKYAPFFGLGAPVPAFLATEEAEHARWFFSLVFLYKRRTLVSHVRPRAGFVEYYLYAATHAGTALRASLATVHGAGK